MTTRYHPLSIMFTAAFALAAAAVPAKDRAELEVKGLRIGMTRAEFTAQFPAAACHSAELCQVSTTIADTAATFNVSFHDGVVDQAYVGKFAAADVTAVVDAFRQKFGEPDSSPARTLKNGYGGTFSCNVYTWNFANGVLTVAKFRAETLTVPEIELRSLERIRRDQAKASKAAADA